MILEIPILAKGEFPHAGAGVVQVVDDASLDAVAGQEIPAGGILLDFDHYSDLTDEERAALAEMGIVLPSEAAGWLKRFSRRGDRVFAEAELTPKGAESVQGKEYRFTSPTFDWAGLEDLGGGRVRPKHVEKVGLTNEPNMRAIGAILANRRALANSGDGGILAGAATELPATSEKPDSENNNQEDKMELEKLAELLGCEATAEAVTAALEALKAAAAKAKETAGGGENGVANGDGDTDDDVGNGGDAGNGDDKEKTELQNRVAKLEAELKKSKIEAELAKHPAVKNRKDAAAVLAADWDAGVKMLAELDEARAANGGSAKGANPENGIANRKGGETAEATGVERIVAALKKH